MPATQTKTAAALICIVLIAACTPIVQPPLTTTQSPPFSWNKIAFVQSGGIAGVLRLIEVSSDGTALARDERSNSFISLQLSEAQLTGLNDLIAGLALVPPAPSRLECMDCFEYDLAIETEPGKTFRVHIVDINLPESGFEELVDYLRDLIDPVIQAGVS